MPDSNKPNSSSQSLFGEKDIVHDIDTVQAKWAREQGRRRVQMVKAFIVGGILLLLALGGVFHRIYKQNQMRLQYEEQQARRYMPIGYKEAKIHIISFLSEDSQDLESMLREAVDTKPSEFYIEFNKLSETESQKVIDILGSVQPGVVINGKHEFSYVETDGQTKQVALLDDPGHSYKLHDLAMILNDVHRQHYGESYVRPIESVLDNRKHRILVEGMEDEPEPEPSVMNDHDDHDHDHGQQHKEEDVEEGLKISPDELIIPKLDVKEQK